MVSKPRRTKVCGGALDNAAMKTLPVGLTDNFQRRDSRASPWQTCSRGVLNLQLVTGWSPQRVLLWETSCTNPSPNHSEWICLRPEADSAQTFSSGAHMPSSWPDAFHLPLSFLSWLPVPAYVFLQILPAAAQRHAQMLDCQNQYRIQKKSICLANKNTVALHRPLLYLSQ